MTTYSWYPSGSNFASPTSWINGTSGQLGDGAPTSGDTAFIAVPATISGSGSVSFLQITDVAAEFNGGTITVATLTTAGASVVPGSLTIDGGTIDLTGVGSLGTDSTLAVNGGAMKVESAAHLTNFGSVVVAGGTLSGGLITNYGNMTVDAAGVINGGTLQNSGTNGTVGTLQVNGTISDDSVQLGILSGQQSVTNVWTGGSWTVGTSMIVGFGSGATLDISGGGSVTAGTGTAGPSPAFAVGVNSFVGPVGVGTVEVENSQGSDGTLSVTGKAVVASDGTAFMYISGGTVSVTGTLDQGSKATGEGTIAVSGADAHLNVTGAWLIGDVGDGRATIEALTGTADVNVSDTIAVGVSSTGVGVLTITGAGQGLTDLGDMLIGQAGAGMVTIQSTGSAAITSIGGKLDIGGQSTAFGTLNVSGAGAVENVSGSMFVGDAGSGTALFSAAGKLTITGSLDLGTQSSGVGNLTVSGAETISAASVVIGDGGKGVVSLQAGAGAAKLTTSGGLTLGKQGSGTGTLTVNGTGQSLGAGGDLVVGSAGAGSLTIQNASGGVHASVTGSVVVGKQATGTGHVILSGTAETMNVGVDVTVGGTGVGAFEIEAGATLSATSGVLLVGSGTAAGSIDIGTGALVDVVTGTIGALGSMTLAGGIVSTGSLTIDGGAATGYGTVTSAVTNNGTITALGGTLDIQGAVDGAGDLVISTGAGVRLEGSSAAAETVQFQAGTLLLDHLTTTQAEMSGFAAGDTIDLRNTSVTDRDFSGGVLTLSTGTLAVGTLHFAGAYDTANFVLTTSGADTLITYTACFAAGTRIATPDGAVRVEDLVVGQAVVTAEGTAPVRWIGRRRIALARHPRRWDVDPVHVAAGAFGAGMPGRELVLSPDHAVYCDGVLIPVRYLVNGATVVQRSRDDVTYYHVELPLHAIIFAEGMPTESYLDTGNRAAFENAGETVMLHADFARSVWAAAACAPLVTEGAVLDSVRSHLRVRAEGMGYRRSVSHGLYVRADGRAVLPRVVGGRFVFAVPEAREVRLVSRVGVPAEMGEGGDCRRLGVAVSRIVFEGTEIALGDGRLGAGWHPDEGGWRWTDGGGALAVSGGVLEVEVAMAAAFWERRTAVA